MTPAFDDHFVRHLPADPDLTNRPRPVLGAAYTAVAPTPVSAPRLVAFADEVAGLVGLPPGAAWDQALVDVFAGNRLLPGMKPFAAAYGGHQFGHWAGQLGDGRAISLGEAIGPDDRRFELQLKGAGPTPYSRTADGRAVMRSSVREFLCSEAMYHLGVPTTRALSLVGTGDLVLRDMFYDGNPEEEAGAVVCRVAPSFLRFGSYELHAARQDHALLRRLVDYTITTHYPELGSPSPQVYTAWLAELAVRTARMVIGWQRVGFVHGVMNTDNMSALGLTIDYGPYGWLEGYDPDWTPNTTDAERRRYRFGMQPQVAGWNLARLCEAVYPLVGAVEPLEAALAVYRDAIDRDLPAMLAAKIGLAGERTAWEPLVKDLLTLLRLVETDWTLFFRGLGRVRSARDGVQALLGAFYTPPDDATKAAWTAWIGRWLAVAPMDDARQAAMDSVNPKVVLRNWVAQIAIDKVAEGDGSLVAELLERLRRPYDDAPDDRWAARRPEWARVRAGCSMLSCSS